MKRQILYVLTLLAVFTSPSVVAQQSEPLTTTPLIQGSQIQQDPSVELLLNDYIKESKKHQGDGFPGYRVQILSLTGTSARDKVLKARSQFMSEHSEFPIYMEYKSPNFKLLVGDCRTKSEALFIRNKIKNSFPNAFVVSDKIQYPQLITEDSQL